MPYNCILIVWFKLCNFCSLYFQLMKCALLVDRELCAGITTKCWGGGSCQHMSSHIFVGFFLGQVTLIIFKDLLEGKTNICFKLWINFTLFYTWYVSQTLTLCRSVEVRVNLDQWPFCCLNKQHKLQTIATVLDAVYVDKIQNVRMYFFVFFLRMFAISFWILRFCIYCH